MRLKNLSLAILAAVSLSAAAQDSVTLANWTFEGGYTVTDGSDNIKIYAPDGSTAADITGWFNQQTPQILPDETILEEGQAYISGGGRYFQLCGGYNTRVLRIENYDAANNVTDYSDPSQHKCYFEATFPTKGYRNVSISYALAPGNNTASAIETVVSTDGGNTWFDAGSCETSAAWWQYTTRTINLSANNKDCVVVRLLSPNEAVTNWNLDFLTITAEKEAAAEAFDADLTAAWPFNLGANNPVAAQIDVPAAISASSWSLGSKIYYNGTQGVNGVTMSKMNPTEKSSKRDANAYVAFSVVPKKGVTLTPSKFKISASKMGTGGGIFDVVAVADGNSYEISTNNAPERNSTGYTAYDLDLSSVGAVSERLEVYVYIYSLDKGKQMGLANIAIEGHVSGVPETVPVYTLSAKAQSPEAGNVAIVPAGAEFDEGTEITVTASENFGYHFDHWQDAEGNTVSNDNPYKFTLVADTDLTAVYTSKNVYSVIVNLEGGANPNLVEFRPAGNVVNGIHYYEENTEVQLVALNNRILSFSNWDDNSTDATRVLVVKSDIELTATFSAEDYIVGWDLYNDDPNSERAADYKASTENAGLLSLHNAQGGTMTWLAGGVNKGQQRGHYCARVWRPFSAGYYFEISFSTLGYSNVRLSAILGNDFVSYTVYDVEYSIDGENYEKFAEYTLPNRGWTEGENALPAAADNQRRVWIRFMADKTSGFTGANWETSTIDSTDGFSVADIYVLADSEAANDEVAPVLVSSLPADGSTGASANGQVILTFDEKVVLADDNATLNGEAISGSVTGKTASFRYTGLAYNTEYTFVLPAGAITDRNGNAFEGCTLSFTTMERIQPEAKLFDAVVAADGSGDFTSVQDAIDAAPANRVKPWLIFIKEGYYKEHVNIPANKPFLHLIGENRETVRICDNRLSGGDNAVHVNEGATVVAFANDLYFEGISFENEYGRDKNDGPQALALNTAGDRIAFNNVKMISYQDTWITTSDANNRHYVNNSWIEGAVDFIYNSGNVFIENTTLNIVRKSGGYIVAPRHYAETEWGYVFVNNKITAPGVPSETSVWLGRPWHDFPKTVFINTVAEVTLPAKGWYNTMGGLPVIWADYNTVDGDGNPVDLSQREDTYFYTSNGERVEGKAKNYLTDEEAATYTRRNVLSGSDNWQPDVLSEACVAPRVYYTAEGDGIVWEPAPYAICYIVKKDGKTVGMTTGRFFAFASEPGVKAATLHTFSSDNGYSPLAKPVYTVQAVSEYGALSEGGIADGITTGIDAIDAEAANAEPVYYNLQGVRVDNPAPGMYIVVRGSSISKQIVR